MKDQIVHYQNAVKGHTPQQIIRFACHEFGDDVIFASSLGEEDQVITDMIAKVHPEIGIFTLDTGRLFEETYRLIAKTQQRYPVRFDVYYPDTEAVEDMVRNHGINLFYESVEKRRMCCGIRKVQPLRRALKDKKAWITGIRRAQAVTRSDVETVEWDEANGLVKINPLAEWSLEQVRKYISENQVDVSPLHAKGFVSIGCSCCTRAISEGEDIRDGRWWWENPQQKECGLHNNPHRENFNKDRQ